MPDSPGLGDFIQVTGGVYENLKGKVTYVTNCYITFETVQNNKKISHRCKKENAVVIAKKPSVGDCIVVTSGVNRNRIATISKATTCQFVCRDKETSREFKCKKGFVKLYREPQKLPCVAKSMKTVCIIGDGNLSFSYSYALLNPGCKCIATVYESKETFEVTQGAVGKAFARILEAAGHVVIYGVDIFTCIIRDIGRLYEQIGKIDEIHFNFPHSGLLNGAGTDLIIQEFLKTGKKLVKDRVGQLHITLVNNNDWYDQRLVKPLKTSWARNIGLKMLFQSNFNPDIIKLGYYNHVKTTGGKRNECPIAEGVTLVYQKISDN